MNEQYQALLNALEYGAIVVQLPELKIMSINNRAAQLLDQTAQDLKGKALTQHLALNEEAMQALDGSQRLKQGYEAQIPFTKADGHKVWYQLTLSYLDDTRGEVLVKVKDITEKKSNVNELELLKAAVEHSVDAILITDANAEDPRITFANSAFEKLTGYSKEEFMGRNPKFLQGPKTDRTKIDELKAAIFAGKACRVYTYNYKKSGEPYLLEWVTSPVKNDQGEIVNWIALQRDITERVRLSREREERETKLMAAMINGQEMERRRIAEDLHDSLGQMISVTNIEVGHLKQHVLKTHSNDETAMTRILKIQSLMGELAKETRMISRHLLPQLLNDLGMIAAIENLASKMQESVNLQFHIRKMGEAYRLDQTQEIAVFRVIQEAMTNAVKHSGADHVYVLFHFRAGTFEVMVRDDGKGLDDEKVTKRRQVSMGLNNIETRAKLIKGKLSISSEPGEGTVVKLSLPIEDESAEEVIPEYYVYPPLPTPVEGADYRIKS